MEETQGEQRVGLIHVYLKVILVGGARQIAAIDVVRNCLESLQAGVIRLAGRFDGEVRLQCVRY
jgi:hypothetical protein